MTRFSETSTLSAWYLRVSSAASARAFASRHQSVQHVISEQQAWNHQVSKPCESLDDADTHPLEPRCACASIFFLRAVSRSTSCSRLDGILCLASWAWAPRRLAPLACFPSGRVWSPRHDHTPQRWPPFGSRRR